MQHPDGRERLERGEACGKKVDVEGRHEIQSGTQQEVAGNDLPREVGVRGRVESGVRVQQRVIPQLPDDHELRGKDHREKETDRDAHGTRPFRFDVPHRDG